MQTTLLKYRHLVIKQGFTDTLVQRGHKDLSIYLGRPLQLARFALLVTLPSWSLPVTALSVFAATSFGLIISFMISCCSVDPYKDARADLELRAPHIRLAQRVDKIMGWKERSSYYWEGSKKQRPQISYRLVHCQHVPVRLMRKHTRRWLVLEAQAKTIEEKIHMQAAADRAIWQAGLGEIRTQQNEVLAILRDLEEEYKNKVFKNPVAFVARQTKKSITRVKSKKTEKANLREVELIHQFAKKGQERQASEIAAREVDKALRN